MHLRTLSLALIITLAATLSGCVVYTPAPVWVPETTVFVGGILVVTPGHYIHGGFGWGHGWRR
jgi:hypothetical protein